MTENNCALCSGTGSGINEAWFNCIPGQEHKDCSDIEKLFICVAKNFKFITERYFLMMETSVEHNSDHETIYNLTFYRTNSS